MGGSAYADEVEYKEFDNFWFCSFTYEGKLWNSTEQAYHAMKFEKEEDIEHIRKQDKIGMIIYYGSSREYTLKPNFKIEPLKRGTKDDCFENANVNLMYKVNLEKYKQNPVLRDRLLMTGTARIIFKDSSTFWNKWNGLIHEKIRDELKKIY